VGKPPESWLERRGKKGKDYDNMQINKANSNMKPPFGTHGRTTHAFQIIARCQMRGKKGLRRGKRTESSRESSLKEKKRGSNNKKRKREISAVELKVKKLQIGSDWEKISGKGLLEWREGGTKPVGKGRI